jgi:diadenosine tetraphosphate (Ap4A) HIT family hydrolase
METQSCLVCETLSGKISPPGGILYSSSGWAFYLHAEPLLVPGQGFAVLKRHCESLDELSFDELLTLGPFLSVVTWALAQGLSAERVHLGLYGEDTRHVHFHVTPRLAGMPRGNIPLTLRSAWVKSLRRARLSRPFEPALVESVAGRLRQVFEQASLLRDGVTR